MPGLEGSFRTACEQVLGELRRNAELLTDLVAAFVTDPLVEWSFVRDDSAASKASFMNTCTHTCAYAHTCMGPGGLPCCAAFASI